MRTCLLALAWFAISCDNSGMPSAGPPGLVVPPPPANGFQVILPPVRGIQPGADLELCTWSKVVDQDIDIKTVQGFQTEPGHHIIVYTSIVRQPEGTTRECAGTDTIELRFVAASAGEGQSAINTAPGDLVFRVAKGNQIVINHHYLNASSRVMDGQSGVNVT